MKRKITYGYVWETGRLKEINEDSLFLRTVKTKNGSFTIGCICDGMGGVGNGEKASGYVLEQLEHWLFYECLSALRRNDSGIAIKGKGIRFFQKVNKELFEFMRKKGIPLGTTASMLLLYEKKGYVFHIGDSRIYRFSSCPFCRKTALVKLLTKDHKEKEGALTRCLGLTPKGEPDFCRFAIPKGHCGFLLCSDGFYRGMEKEQLKCLAPKALRSPLEIERRLKEIAWRMEEKGELDNLSALYIQVE